MAQQPHGTTAYSMAQPGPHPSRSYPNTQEALLLLYMIDYCEKHQYTDSAAALRREGRLQPDAKCPVETKEGLLYEWWTCFWAVYIARVNPDKSVSKHAKIYAESLNNNPYVQPHNIGQSSNGRMGGGPPLPGSAAQTAPGINGQGPSYGTNPSSMNGAQPPPPTSGAMPGMAAANPTLHNPNLQHLQQRIPAIGPGMQKQPIYMQRPHGIPGPPVAPMPMQMNPGPPQQRMANGVVYTQNPNYRPQPGQQSPQQQQEMQTATASGSPKQPGAPSTTQNSSPHQQGANGNAHESSEANQQGTPRNQPSRGQKRPSPAEDDQYSKDASPPDRKKPRRSPQENGAALPTTPSLAAAQPPGNGRPPMPAGKFNGMAPNKGNPMMGGMSFSTPGVVNGSTPLGPQGMSPAIAGQLQQLTQTQTDQQYFAYVQQRTIDNYNINQRPHPAQQNPTLTGPPGVSAEPTVRETTSAPKGAMLPPPPPNALAGQPTSGAGGGTPGKNTPVTSGLQPRNSGNKDGSSPGEGVSPETARPGSRPIPGSTPQMTPAPMPGAASTPGGASSMSAPSPSQMNTSQQISRPQMQSPSQVVLTRPSTVTTNGMVGAGSAPNPSALLATGYGGNVQPAGANGATGGGQAGSAASNSGMGGSNEMLGGGPLPNDLFMSLSNAPFDFQMMGYQDEDTFGATVALDFVSNFGMDETYNMSMYLNDSLDSVNGS